MVKIAQHPEGPRLTIVGQRVHHGAVGIIAMIALRKHPKLAALALAPVIDDLHDWRFWFALGDGQLKAELASL
jgi:hypothetical protein